MHSLVWRVLGWYANEIGMGHLCVHERDSHVLDLLPGYLALAAVSLLLPWQS